MSRWPVAGPSEYWLIGSSPASEASSPGCKVSSPASKTSSPASKARSPASKASSPASKPAVRHLKPAVRHLKPAIRHLSASNDHSYCPSCMKTSVSVLHIIMLRIRRIHERLLRYCRTYLTCVNSVTFTHVLWKCMEFWKQSVPSYRLYTVAGYVICSRGIFHDILLGLI